MRKAMMICAMLAAGLLHAQAEADPNFWVYLCFGQSNMEGQAQAQAVDNTVDPRFKMMACVDFQNPVRKQGQWYSATPPLVRQWTNVGMADYFGRTMVAALPREVSVGVVDVAIGGVDIRGFMQEEVASYLGGVEQWMKNMFAEYDNDPYRRLVDMARIAQQSGVIKGILLHQGETNNGQDSWRDKVKTVYERLLNDLGLRAQDVPLFVGETVNADVGGICSLHNTVIARLPEKIPTAHVVHSAGCPCASDNIHFTIDGYRTMGKRYATEALRVMGRPIQAQADYQWNASLKKIYELSRLEAVDDITLRVGGSKSLTIWGTFADGHRENLTSECRFSGQGVTLSGNTVTAQAEGRGTVTVGYTDFLGQDHSLVINVDATLSGPNQVLVLTNPNKGSNQWDNEALVKLAKPMQKGKTYVVSALMRADNPSDFALWPRYDASTNRDQWGNSADIQYLATHTLTADFREYSWTFRADHPHDVLIFAIGKMGGNVYIDDLSCHEQGSTVEMIANGSFDSDNISNWSVLGWTGQKMAVAEDATAGISAPTATASPRSGATYDLQGRRLDGRSAKGIVIVDGRKVVARESRGAR